MKTMLHKGFKPSKCKTSLKLAVSRIKLLRNKKEIQLNQLKREVAKLLETGQDQTARIRVEHVIREQKTIAAYDLLDIYCELIIARMPIIESQKNCPIDLKEAIASVIFASPRCSDIQELTDVRKHFTAKYGKEFVTAAIELRPDCGVNRTFVEKLSANAPDGPTKVKILTGIAEEHNFKWEPNWFKDDEPVPPAYVPNAPYTDKTHVEPLNQAAPIFEAKHEIPSNINTTAGSQVNSPKFAYAAARPSGTETEKNEYHQSSIPVEDASFAASPRWNMEFTDASTAAHVAAESAELASIAARAAAKLASRDQFTDHTTTGSKFVQNERNRGHISNTVQSGPVDNCPMDNSFHERPSRMGDMQKYPNRQAKTSAMVDKNSFKKEYYHSVEHDRPNSFRQANSSMKAAQKEATQKYMEKRRTTEVNYPKRDYEQSLDQYGKVRDDLENVDKHDSSPEDPELSSTYPSQVAHNYEYEAVSYSNNRHDDSVDHPLHEGDVETRNQRSSYRSQASGMSESYGVISYSNLPKYDSDPDVDTFDSIGQGSFCKEDVQAKEPSWQSAFHSPVHQDLTDEVLASEQRKHEYQSHKHPFVDADDKIMHTEKDTNASTNDAAPKFDDEFADETDYIQSSGRKSPVYSSPDEDHLPKKWGISSSKHLYQTEFSESFKNSTLYSQLNKPLSLGDDSDGASSENDEETQKPKIGTNVNRNSWKPEIEHRGHDDFVGPSYGGRGSSSFISEESTIEGHSEESLEKNFGASVRKKFDFGDLSTTKQDSRIASSKSNARSFNRQSFSRLLEEAERLSSPRTPSLQEIPDVIDDSQYSYQSNAESGTELNVESLPGGLRNKGYKNSPYARGASTYSLSSSISTADDTPKPRQRSTSSSSEIKELSGLKESNRRKNPTSRLQGTYFDPAGDDPEEDTEYKSPKLSDGRTGYMNPRSRVPESYFDSEDISSQEEVVEQTLSPKVRSGTGFSRRTRASGLSRVAGSQTETRTSYERSSAMESVSEKEPSLSTSYAVDTPAKPKKKPARQMENSELQRRREVVSRPSHLSNMSSGKEISAPSVARKQAPSSKEVASGAETDENPMTLSSNEKTLLRENSDKKASHVHPKLPDCDDIAAHFLSLRQSRQ